MSLFPARPAPVFVSLAVSCALLSSCGGDPLPNDPAACTPDLTGMSEAHTYECAEQRFWQAFQHRGPERVTTYDDLQAAYDHFAPGDSTLVRERANVIFRRGQLGMAITLEQPELGSGARLDIIRAVVPAFEEVERMVPDHTIAFTWRASMEIALAHIGGDDAAAVAAYDAAEARILADPLGNGPSISGTAIGLPMRTGVPTRVMALVDGYSCTGASFCTENTEHAPWALPGMAYHWAEHYIRVGRRDEARAWIDRSRAAEGYDTWPQRAFVELVSNDLDGKIAEFAALGEEGSAFNRLYSNGSSGCLFCHEKLD